MQTTFAATISAFKKIDRIDGAWGANGYKALLELMGLDEGFDDLPADELKEMCLMALSDMEPQEAANIVLTHLFADTLTEGKIEQMSHDMLEDRMWEDYSDCLAHEQLFNAYGLLRAAFNGTFAKPTGVKFTLTLTSNKPANFAILEEPVEAVLVRLLANGLDENEILNRLYEEQITGDTFVEAPGILWIAKPLSRTEKEASYELVGSEFWFGRFDDIETFEGKTHADVVEDEDD